MQAVTRREPPAPPERIYITGGRWKQDVEWEAQTPSLTTIVSALS